MMTSMFDTTLIEKITSVMMLFTVPMVGLMFPMLAFILGILVADGTQGYAIASAIGICGFAGGLVFTIALLLILKRSRSGRARPFLEEIQAEVGGEVRMGSLLWSLLSPRIHGEIDGHKYRLTFRRQGGIIGAADIGSRFLLWGWAFDLVVTAPWKGTAGFLPEVMPAFGLVLFGISGPAEVRNGMKTFAGGTEGGAKLVADEQALEAAKVATSFGRHGSIVRVKRNAIRMSGFVPDGATPADVAALLKICGALASRALALG
jgi:hypothetical protein